MHRLAVISDGTRENYPMYYWKAEKKLVREQRKLSHCVKESSTLTIYKIFSESYNEATYVELKEPA